VCSATLHYYGVLADLFHSGATKHGRHKQPVFNIFVGLSEATCELVVSKLWEQVLVATRGCKVTPQYKTIPYLAQLPSQGQKTKE
jgi:hypothetical protein